MLQNQQDNTKFATVKETEINKLQQKLDEKLQLKNINNNIEEEQQSLTELDKSVNNEITILDTTEDRIIKCTNDVEQEIKLVTNADIQLEEEIDELNSQMEKIDHEKKIAENDSSENE